MKILFAAAESAWGGILGKISSELPEHEFEVTGGFNINTLNGIDVLIPTMTKITEETLQTANQLKLIQQCGSGLEGVAIEAARLRDIQVANVPTEFSGNADSVAELGVYLMIGLARNQQLFRPNLIEGKMGEPMGLSLWGKTAGLVGIGGIGKALIKRLKPFGMRIIGIKRSNLVEVKKELGLDWIGKPDDLKILLNQSDFVVLSLPCDENNQQMINAETLAEMKKSAFLINLSRGGLISHQDLKVALSNQQLAGVGLDVFWQEPPDVNDEIFKHNVMATPHIAGSTDVSLKGIVDGVVENIRRVASGQVLLNTYG